MNALDHALQPLAGLRLARLPRATRLCLEMLDRLDGGAIAVELPDGVRVRAGHGPLVAHLRVRDHAVFDEALGRFIGTLLSGLLYQWGGLLYALIGSALMLGLCWAATLALPTRRALQAETL